MRTYTVHLPGDARVGDPAAYERAVLVRDGFVWPAFFFSVLWMLWHRLWLAAIASVVALAAFSWALGALGVDPGAAVLANLLVSVLIGLEASSLRRWTYARRGWRIVDVVSAPGYDEADALACARWMALAARPAPAPALVAPGRDETPREIVPFGFAGAEGAR
ncbi:DUF2628 domain-containing protein [Salinarimonas ramus]|uniref:DUF2628 domain-containing protein n=1 Tax=Salinarimonas ramus TaxID=690164 RepID=A0A917V3J7_9HYPH|nr:DUF2628 domain-containing protein [Salinarimonas ramus]GGK32207.1 hypothetical protein GCM10011322_18610 [Salinarimonas ramus]